MELTTIAWFLLSVSIVLVIALLVILVSRKRVSYQAGFLLRDYNLKEITINNIDKMVDGSEFEVYLHRLFRELGYMDAYKTKGSHDFGADLVFTDRTGIRTILQAKRYSPENMVGIEAVQQVYTARNYYQAKKAIVLATTSYTDSCETIAGVNGVLLLNRRDLVSMLEVFKEGKYEKAKDIIEREPRIIYEFWDHPERQLNRDTRALWVKVQ